MSLTGHLNDASSPVRHFFDDYFPNTAKCCSSKSGKPNVNARVNPQTSEDTVFGRDRWRPGDPIVLPLQADGYPWATVGTAIDYRLRYQCANVPIESTVAWKGAQKLLFSQTTPFDVVVLFKDLSNFIDTLIGDAHVPQQRLNIRKEQDLARSCYILALFEQCFRAPVDLHGPLMRNGPRTTLRDLLELCDISTVDDIVRVAHLFWQTQANFMTEPKVILNPTFSGSRALGGADADLIVGSQLIDIKSSIKNELSRAHLLQVLGYCLADWDDEYELTSAGIYFARQGVSIVWPLEALCSTASVEGWSLLQARKEFRKVVQPLKPPSDDDGIEVSLHLWAQDDTLPTSSETYYFEPELWKIATPLPFRPPISGQGKWHVSIAENTKTVPDKIASGSRSKPACGSSTVELDLAGETLIPKKGHLNSKYQDRLCGKCLRLTRT